MCLSTCVHVSMSPGSDALIKWVKEDRNVSILVETDWSGLITSRPIYHGKILPMPTQRQSAIPKARNPSM